MVRKLISFLLASLIAFPLFAGDPDTINTVPSATSSFLTDLQTFLREEDADRFSEQFVGFVSSGGTHGTAAGLVGTPDSMVAYPNGGRITETSSITYPDADTCWVIASRPTTGNLGTYTRVAGTHYLTDCASGSIPALPAGTVQLMEVTTAGGAITAVTDLRVRSAIAGSTFALPSYTLSTLPSAAVAGRAARVTDDDVRNVRGIYLDQGSQWYNLFGGVINARSFPGVTGNCANDQTTGLTNWINALNAVPAQNIRQVGYLPRGCYRYTSALPVISGNGVTIVGDGLQSVLFNATSSATTHALVVTGQNVTLQGITIEGIPGSGHGIRLNQSHYFTARDVVVISTGTAQNGWQVEGVITGLFINVRGTCNVPGCPAYTTDITGNGGRGTPGRAVNILDGSSESNNNHSWINFRNNGGHSGHGVVIGGSTTGVTFTDAVFEDPDPTFYAILISGASVKNNVFIDPYISCSTGLGLNIFDATANTIVGGQSNCATLLDGDAKSNSFVNFETTGNVDILVNVATPRMNSFFGGRITGTLTDNGTNTTFIGVTDNTNAPLTNKLQNITIAGGSNINYIRNAVGSLNFDFSAGGITCQDLTIAVTSAPVGGKVILGLPDGLGTLAGVLWSAWVSATGTVTVRGCDVTSSNVDPAAANVEVMVINEN